MLHNVLLKEDTPVLFFGNVKRINFGKTVNIINIIYFLGQR